MTESQYVLLIKNSDLLLLGGYMIFNAYSDSSDGIFGISVKSAGQIFADNGRRISRPSGREDWLLFYVAKGTERFFLEGRTDDANDGSFIFFRPNEKQDHICVGDKKAEFYFVHFDAPENFELFGFRSSTVYGSDADPTVTDLFSEIITELQTKRAMYEKICAAKLLELIGYLARRKADEKVSRYRYGSQISFVIQNMNREFYEDRALEDYADMCKMSRFHFLRVFKEVTGQSPMEYRNSIRIEHAKRILEDEDIPVSDVGLRVGYTSPSYFCDAFKKKVGSSPQKYRQNTKMNK